MDASTVTSLLTAASVPSSAIAAVADVVLEGEKMISPLVLSEIAHRYDNALTDRITEAVNLTTEPDPAKRAYDQLAYDQRMFIDCGNPVAGGIPGEPLEGVRVSVLLAYRVIAAKYLRDEAVNADLIAQIKAATAPGK